MYNKTYNVEYHTAVAECHSVTYAISSHYKLGYSPTEVVQIAIEKNATNRRLYL